MNFNIKQLVPHLVAVAIFITISLTYFSPIMQGKRLQQSDISHFKGMSKEIVDFREKTGEEALWTNSMFGGMPAFQISVKYAGNLISYIDQIFTLGIPSPANYLFLYLLGFYILMVVLGVHHWLAIVGAFAFAFSSYFFIIIDAGHNSKAHAIGYMAPVLAGVILTFKRHKSLIGPAIFGLFLALELKANHLQITYYLAMLLFVIIAGILYDYIKNKSIKEFVKPAVLLSIAAVLALGTNIASIWSTYEYSKETIRGNSELTINGEKKSSGLDRNYITAWSYGIEESFSLLVPNAKGGPSGAIGDNQSALKSIIPQLKQAVAQSDAYFGEQPFTSGPVYVGVIVVFLFVLGLFLVDGYLKWALLAATILSLFLSWGKHFMDFTDLFLDFLPGYNKFRAVSMILVIAELTIPLLGIITLQKIISEPHLLKEKKKQFFIASGIVGGLVLLMYLSPTLFTDFFKAGEIDNLSQQLKQAKWPPAQMNAFFDGIEQARQSVLQADALRSLLFIVLAFGVLFLFSIQKIKNNILIIVLGVLILGDMWSVDKRYLNNEKDKRGQFVRWQNKKKIQNPYQATDADLQILQDKDPNFRVFNTTIRLDQDAKTSYFHKSLGGYHGAKLKRYQELIDYQLGKNNLDVVNMLNAKYFIMAGQNQQPIVQQNPKAMGNAWFVNDYKIVANADSEITALSKFNPAKICFIDQRFKPQLNGFKPKKTGSEQITLTEYKPNHLTYHSKNTQEGLAVFSEIYYANGWTAYIDAVKTPYFRCNYVLRAMRIPKGEHTVEFKFNPISYSVGNSISLVSSAILILLLIGVGFKELKEGNK